MSLPYFPMFPTDFEAKTSHLTLAEDGAYNRLLRLTWMTPGCSIPADRAWVYRRMRALTEVDQAVVETVIAEFFKEADGRLSNARLTLEWLAANEAHTRRKNAGAKGGKAKALKNNDIDLSNATPMLKQPEPEPEERGKPLLQSAAEAPDDFESAWKLYQSCPLKAGQVKKLAKSQWSRAVKRAGDAGPILKAIAAEVAARRSPEGFVANLPAMHRWLSGDRWQDALREAEAAQAGAAAIEVADDEWRRLLKTWHDARSWPPYAGPQPGQDGCRVPDTILTRYRAWAAEQNKLGAAA